MKIILKQDALNSYMSQNGLNVYTLAEKIDVAPSTIYRLKNGDRGVGNDLIAKLLSAFELTESDFDKLFIFNRSLPLSNGKGQEVS